MADITINIPNPQVDRVLDAFAHRYNYQDNVWIDEQYVPNPQSKAAFAKEKVIEFIKNVVRHSELEEARKTAESSVADDTGLS